MAAAPIVRKVAEVRNGYGCCRAWNCGLLQVLPVHPDLSRQQVTQ